MVAVATVVLAVSLWRRFARPNDEGRHLAHEMDASQMPRSPIVDLSESVIQPTDNSYGPHVADTSRATSPAPPENALDLAKSAASVDRENSAKIVKADGQGHIAVEGGGGLLSTSTRATSMTSVALSADPLPCGPPVHVIPKMTTSESAVTHVPVSRKSTGSVFPGGVGINLAVAVMEAASAVASSSSIPGVSEAARLISVLVTFVVDKTDNDAAGDWRVRWCRSIVAVLERASELMEKVSETSVRMLRLSDAKYTI